MWNNTEKLQAKIAELETEISILKLKVQGLRDKQSYEVYDLYDTPIYKVVALILRHLKLKVVKVTEVQTHRLEEITSDDK